MQAPRRHSLWSRKSSPTNSSYVIPPCRFDKSAESLPRMLRFHQRLTNQETLEPGSSQPSYVLTVANSALCNPYRALRNIVDQLERCLKRHVKVMQIAVVDADHLATSAIQCALQFLTVMHFTEDVQSRALCSFVHLAQFRVAECCNDKQNRVSTVRPRFEYLEVIDHEIFSQTRSECRRGRQLEIS